MMQDQACRKSLFISHCCFNCLPELESLLGDYPSTNARDGRGKTRLSIAARSNAYEILVYLRKNSALINSVSNKGRTPLMEAALWGNASMAEYLVAHGANKRRSRPERHDRLRFNNTDCAQPQREEETPHTRPGTC
ncbi:hypothetical protein ABVK25_009000 [Lepraria finkii]|uniref:Uncharacterized protein n=1 Tax=Lepraria finkii TaxID=1340010 RepID=A0ABR4B0M4_9LECA